ncbi:MAG: DNA polymerase/3'-5' exonuclease PolX [Acidobacteriota bacterium]
MKNKDVAAIFDRIADILEFKSENPFKIRAYRKVARIIADLSQDIEKINEEGKLKEIPGVGEGIAKKIKEYIDTGRMKKYEEVKAGIPDELIAMLAIPSLGPKSLALIHSELKVRNIGELKKAIEDGRVAGLKGFGEKKASNILKGIALHIGGMERMPLGIASPIAEAIITTLRKNRNISAIEPAGSLRRSCETVGDIDILAAGKNGKEIINAFVHLPQVREVLAAGETKGSIRVEEGKQVDLRVVDEESFGSALQYFTGSKNHNIKLREIAKEKGYKLSEYGIFRNDDKVAGKTEREVYEKLGMKWIPPELREDAGEIEAAIKDRLPELVKREDIRGDLHVHTEWSDGTLSLEVIASIAGKMKYEYVVIADHSRSLRVAGGLSVDDLYRQMEEIDRINKKLKALRILKGAEVDILSRGSTRKSPGKLDYPDDLLKRLDIVIAAIHTGFTQSEDEITGRIISAMANPHVDIIAHPTGRLIGEREAYRVNMEKVMKAAAEHGKALEINGYYLRLDLNHIHCRMARDMGVKVAIGTDAHSEDHFIWMKYGIAMARRGWLTRSDVINTMHLKDLLKWLKH